MSLEPLPAHAPQLATGRALRNLTLGALGVVYGDIGTSPLYAITESFNPSHGLALTTDNILGILSLVFWSLTLVVSIKYLIFILRADNRGEGGIMALLALIIPKLIAMGDTKTKRHIIFLGLFGAALLYGDGVITPAISVLSAVEGLSVATPNFQPYVVPITVGILFFLFSSQRGGTAKLGAIFGRTAFVWFLTLIATGLPWIIRQPAILKALNPYYAVNFFMMNGMKGYFVLGAVVLCITGGEALYADLGHFGKKPIRIGWFYMVFPALLVNYFGQGALVLEKGADVIGNTFYGLVSGWMIYPLVAIATVATIIASQALISGAFSLTQQAMQLGYFPRIQIFHTSRETEGQIYVPKVNLLLMFGCIALVIHFQQSSNLAAAYGIAVTATMSITSILFFIVARMLWNWSLLSASLLVGGFLVFDLAFFGANIIKIHEGGWVPVVIGIGIFLVMITWKKGRETVSELLAARAIPLTEFIKLSEKKNIHRIKGTAVFMTLGRDIAPYALIHHLDHNQVLHEKILLLTVVTSHNPEIPPEQRVQVTEFPYGFSKVVATYGYIESPDVSDILDGLERIQGIKLDREKISYYLGRETILTGGCTKFANWRKRLFVFFSRNSRPATEYFKIPPEQVIEIGTHLRI